MAERNRVVSGEIYWAAETVSGRRHRCLTPWKAATTLDTLDVAGEVVCENTMYGPTLTTVQARRHADGTWEPLEYDGPEPDDAI